MKYTLSQDKKGLIKYIDDYNYHIHSDEMYLLEKIIRYFLLLKEKYNV